MKQYGRVHIGEVPQERGLPLAIERGWDKSVAEQLPVLSRQAHILQRTPNDAARRFKNTESADAWYADPQKDPKVYILGRGTTALAGLIWFSDQSHEQVPGAVHTFAIRLYEGYTGRGLSFPFALAAHEDFAATAAEGPIWLETDEDNEQALSTYRRLGYAALPKDENGRLVMVKNHTS